MFTIQPTRGLVVIFIFDSALYALVVFGRTVENVPPFPNPPSVFPSRSPEGEGYGRMRDLYLELGFFGRKIEIVETDLNRAKIL